MNWHDDDAEFSKKMTCDGDYIKNKHERFNIGNLILFVDPYSGHKYYGIICSKDKMFTLISWFDDGIIEDVLFYDDNDLIIIS